MTEKDFANLPNHHFINTLINEDLKEGKYDGRVHTRFPPEPNGYLHIGHAKAIFIDFGTALEYQGLCNLRMDDTNPTKEDVEYVDAIQEDIRWLGYDWGDRFFYASDYFEQMYQYAVELIKKGLAYVCELSPEQMKQMRGDLTTPAQSPYRDRPIEENLDLFARMRAGEFENGAMTLRAKIDLASPNFNMRDPAIYRINHMRHHRTGDAWCIYPMYDFAHPLEDALEGITHSLCSLEFEDHRPLYDWVIEHCDVPCRSRQIEFARLGITNTVMSKRKLRALVEGGYVTGWDDPRMPTLAGMRRRGYPAAAVRNFCEKIGVAKSNSTVEFAMLEFCVRENLNVEANRAMAVLDPLKVVITNYPEEKRELLPADNNLEKEGQGKRDLPFSNTIYIEKSDFMEEPVKGFHRLIPGGEVRLKYAYIIRCEEVVKDEEGNIAELRCTYDPTTKSGNDTSGKKVKGTIHWVDAETAVPAEIRLYQNLFTKANPDDVEEGEEFTDYINPESLVIMEHALLESSLEQAAVGVPYQFMRQGYFVKDPDSTPGKPVFNRIVSLKDSWAKKQKA
ncbi:MAG: glutamine--tRNA ligase/YqeY domain fusion protein [Firmicutes bacterium]|nr:glutamine--tRNA ligase/YqeY domain fusion protein [Bacillota bacterium]